jgi:hypothetical protein
MNLLGLLKAFQVTQPFPSVVLSVGRLLCHRLLPIARLLPSHPSKLPGVLWPALCRVHLRQHEPNCMLKQPLVHHYP